MKPLLAILLLFLPLHARAEDWPAFLGPRANSTSSEKGILSPWPKDGLKIVWHQPIGIGYGMPSIADGKLYLFDRHGDKARATCLDARTGKEHWRFEYATTYKDYFNYNGGPRCCPVVDGDLVFLHGVEGMLHCLKASTGEVVWKLDTMTEFHVLKNFFGVGSCPVVEGDLLITQIGGADPTQGDKDFILFNRLKPNNLAVVAFEKRTGKIRYKIGDDLASYSTPVLATINGRRWCFVFARQGLLAFNPADGKVDFHYPFRAEDFESVNASNPVVVGDQVLISETYGPGSTLLKVKPGGHEVIWDDVNKPARLKSMMCHWMTPVYHNGFLYGSSNRHTNQAELRCVDWKTGKVLWREHGLTRASLLQIDGHFICLGEDGMVRLLKVNPDKYDEISTWEPIDPKTKAPLLQEPCWAAPIVVDGLLYLRGNGHLVCAELIPKR